MYVDVAKSCRDGIPWGTYLSRMGLRIRELRKKRGLTQVQLSDKAGLSRPLLAQIESGSRPANTLRLASIAKALEVAVEDLFEVEDEEGYRRLILDLMRSMTPEDRAAVLRVAQGLARND